VRREASSAPSRPRTALAVLAPLFSVAALLAGGGCAELRAPPDRGLPLLLSLDPGDPLRGTVRAAASDFAEAGRALAGRPREAALAAARLEYLSATVPSDPRFAPIPASVGLALLTARAELRRALGTRTEAPPRPVIAALVEVARALGAGDPAAAAGALSPALFEPGGTATLQRLGELGPLPAAMLAAQQAASEVARLDADQRWFGTAAAEPAVSAGQTTIGLGEAGY
jgi:hypothetical protein